jgi:hypothetical protein
LNATGPPSVRVVNAGKLCAVQGSWHVTSRKFGELAGLDKRKRKNIYSKASQES